MLASTHPCWLALARLPRPLGQLTLLTVRQARSERTDIATLLIPAITAADAGFYLCVATSPAGTAQARIQVVVLPGAGPLGTEAVGRGKLGEGSQGRLHSPLAPASGASSPPVRIESSSPSVTEGQTLDLNCVVAGLAHASITWYKRGGSLPPHSQVWGVPEPVAGALGVIRCSPQATINPDFPPSPASVMGQLGAEPGRA